LNKYIPTTKRINCPSFSTHLMTLIFIPEFITSDFNDLLIVISFLLGIIGYIGLWQNLLSEGTRKSTLNKMSLITGIIAATAFLFIMRLSINLSIGLFVFLWPTIVSIIILTDLLLTSDVDR